ncbi:MAG: hypothetical protein LBR75_03365, partial [Prevotellaceae bacterium]|nr:hypothetical protein [Prevotellaceae bacterium]
MKNLLVRLFVAAALLAPAGVAAQVTIGSSKVPENFSVLEIDAHTHNRNGGLRLPQLSQVEIDALAAEITGKDAAKGLRVYNKDRNCVYTWNGTTWIEWGCEVEGGPCVANPVSIIGSTSVCADEAGLVYT